MHISNSNAGSDHTVAHKITGMLKQPQETQFMVLFIANIAKISTFTLRDKIQYQIR